MHAGVCHLRRFALFCAGGVVLALVLRGSAAGDAALVKDINTVGEGTWPTEMTAVGGTLFFTADDGIHGRELWANNGTGGHGVGQGHPSRARQFRRPSSSIL